MDLSEATKGRKFSRSQCSIIIYIISWTCRDEVSTMAAGQKFGLTKIQAMFMEIFGLSRAVSLSAILLISLVTIFAVFWFFHSAPPDTITITSGPKGSIFETNAEKYAQILARNGVKLKILPSQGSWKISRGCLILRSVPTSDSFKAEWPMG